MSKYGIELSEVLGIKTPQSVADGLMERLVKRRKKLGYSRKKLAELSHVKEPTIRYAETTGKIALLNLLKIAEVLDVLDEFDALLRIPVYRSIEEI